MVTKEEGFILKTLSESGGEMSFKALNEACADHFEGCRIILKKLKEQGFVDYEGVVPSISGTIHFIKNPEERERVAEKARAMEARSFGGPKGDAQFTVVKILREHGGRMKYSELNVIFSEKYEGLRLVLKKMKDAGSVEYDGDMPGTTSSIKLLD